MAEHQLEEERKEEEAEEHERFMERCRAAFIDKVYGDTLFTLLFDKDKDGRRLCQVPTIQELVQQYPFYSITRLVYVLRYKQVLWGNERGTWRALFIDRLKTMTVNYGSVLEIYNGVKRPYFPI